MSNVNSPDSSNNVPEMTNSTSTDTSQNTETTIDFIVNRTLLLNMFDPNYLYLTVAVIVGNLVVVPFLVSICFKLFKSINTFIRSYNRILTNMISESIYELQFFQTVACFSYINVNYVFEAKAVFESLKYFIYLDPFDKMIKDSSLSEGLPPQMAKFFTNRFFDNSHTFLLLFLFGASAVGIIWIYDYLKNRDRKKIEFGKVEVKLEGGEDQKDEKQMEEKVDDNVMIDNENMRNAGNNSVEAVEEEEKENNNEIKLNYMNAKFQKCSVESNRQYFLLNYFIRVYQITMTKVTFTCLLVINNYDLPTASIVEVFFTYFILIFWVLGLPMALFYFLRQRQNNLMSPNFIIKYGTLYLNYKGISKDVYAFLMQIKFAILPVLCVFFWKFPKLQLILLVILYFFNIMFITIYVPFCKVSKVFTEALSEGVLLIFCILILILEFFKQLKESLIPGYFTLVMFVLLLFFRAYRVLLDTIFRIKDLFRIKQPYLIGVDEPHVPKTEKEKEDEEKQIEIELKSIYEKDYLADVDNESEEPKEDNENISKFASSFLANVLKGAVLNNNSDDPPVEVNEEEKDKTANLTNNSQRHLLDKSEVNEAGDNKEEMEGNNKLFGLDKENVDKSANEIETKKSFTKINQNTNILVSENSKKKDRAFKKTTICSEENNAKMLEDSSMNQRNRNNSNTRISGHSNVMIADSVKLSSKGTKNSISHDKLVNIRENEMAEDIPIGWEKEQNSQS